MATRSRVPFRRATRESAILPFPVSVVRYDTVPCAASRIVTSSNADRRIATGARRRSRSCSRLADTIWRAHYPGILPVEQIDYMLERGYAHEALGGIPGARRSRTAARPGDGEPSAFAAWYVTEDPAAAKLDKLYVLPSRQRHGLGGMADRATSRSVPRNAGASR